LVLSFNATSKPEIVEISGQFRNDFFPYDIRYANIGMNAGFKGSKEIISSQLSTNKILDIPAGGESEDIIVKISVPPIPSFWDPEVIFSSGYRVNGILNFELSDQKLEISNNFIKSMLDLFPKDPLPDLFIPGESSKNSATVQPLLIQVVYPTWPLIVFGILVLMIAGAVITGIIVLRREKIYRVSIDGMQKTYGLRPFSTVVIKDSQDNRVGVFKRGLVKPVSILDKGKTCNIRVM